MLTSGGSEKIKNVKEAMYVIFGSKGNWIGAPVLRQE